MAPGAAQPTGRSSAITLPSFGRLPGATSFTSPLSLVTDCSVAATASCKPPSSVCAFGRQRHRVLLARARDGEAQAAELGMALADLRHLAGMHEHALHFRGLVGAAHPALDPHIAAPARRATLHRRREVAGREPDHRIVRIERGDDDLADLALRDRIAGAGPHDLDQQGLVDDHPLFRFALVGDDAEIGGGVALQHRDPARGQFLPQRGRQRRARHQPALDG